MKITWTCFIWANVSKILSTVITCESLNELFHIILFLLSSNMGLSHPLCISHSPRIWIYHFTSLFLAVLGLHCCVGFSEVAEMVGSVIVVPRLWAQAQCLWHMGLVALRPMGSSQTRDRTRISCIGRCSLYHRATREASTSEFKLAIL